jgi:hypothetical protein
MGDRSGRLYTRMLVALAWDDDAPLGLVAAFVHELSSRASEWRNKHNTNTRRSHKLISSALQTCGGSALVAIASAAPPPTSDWRRTSKMNQRRIRDTKQ